MSKSLPEQQKLSLNRLRGLHYTNMLERYPHVRGDSPDAMTAATAKWFSDCRVVVELGLSQFHHDDNENVTAECLESRGFTKSGDSWLIEDEDGNILVQDTLGDRFFQFVPDPDDPSGQTGVYIGNGLGEVLRQEPGSTLLRLRRADGTVLVFRNDPLLDGTVKPLISIEAPHGEQINLIYTDGRPTELRHSNGQTLTLSYDADGRLTELLDHAGATTTFEYDPSGEYLLSVSGPDGQTSYTYDTTSTGARLHALESIENSDGTHTFYDYDAAGRLTGMAYDGDAQPISISYPVGGEVVVTDAAGNSEAIRYDARGRLAQVENVDGEITEFRYDEQPSSVTK